MTRVDILCTDPTHGVNAWLERWVEARPAGVRARVLRDTTQLGRGDFLFLVSCHQIVGAAHRAGYRHTLVLHASALPHGRGMSPHIWQVLEGRTEITLTLMEAVDRLDEGRIWHQLPVAMPADAVCSELNARLFDAELALMDWALAHCDHARPRPQHGEPSYYRKRRPDDSRLDPDRSLAEQFDLLRVADPERYPAFFEHRGRRYKLLLEPDDAPAAGASDRPVSRAATGEPAPRRETVAAA
jgi:methionyl-tRNA formyltransferase